MIVGILKEVKSDEYRVAMLPAGVHQLVRTGHRVLVQSQAGVGSGISDADYKAAGAEVAAAPADVWAAADLIVKVKEPQPGEFAFLRRNLMVLTYFHFAAEPKLLEACITSGVSAIAYETIRDARGLLPCLTPMSEVAGKMAIQEGAKYLERPMMGRGILLGGVPGVAPAEVVILGGGVVGHNAARVAAGLGARVSILDINLDRLRYLSDVMPANVNTIFSDVHTVREALARADLVVGAVLIPGAKAPRLIGRDDIKHMIPGSVIVDVAIDQGGCVETSRPTTHQQPTYLVDGVVHYCVTNMPGAVGRTSTFALCNATFPYVAAIASLGWDAAARRDPGLAQGLNTRAGEITNAAVAAAMKG
ncbi:MAG: alanine dehydrogenase [Phycisphaerales bacterium]|nr:alanine dehydrogenase [Phycisphaerales bacterium]